MDIQQLRTFYVVARAGSFSKAVTDLNLSQPAISRQVMLLEESLKTRLFNRHARKGLVLTAEGEILLGRTGEILRNLASLKSCLSVQNDPQGLLRVATSHFQIAGGLMGDLVSFMKQYPHLQLHVLCQEEPMDLTLREADVYIGPYNPALLAHEQELILTQHLRFYASEEYVAQHGAPTHKDDLRKHRVLMYAYSKDAFHQKNAKMVGPGAISRTLSLHQATLVMNSLEGLLEAVTKGLGIAALPEDLPGLAERHLVPLLPTQPPMTLPLYFAYLAQCKNQPNIKAFLQHLKEQCKKRLARPEVRR